MSYNDKGQSVPDFILTMRLMESLDEEHFLILSKEFYRLGMNLLEGPTELGRIQTDSDNGEVASALVASNRILHLLLNF